MGSRMPVVFDRYLGPEERAALRDAKKAGANRYNSMFSEAVRKGRERENASDTETSQEEHPTDDTEE